MSGPHKYKECPDYSVPARIHEDPCYIDCRANTSRKPLKYITRDFHNLGCNPNSLCYPGFLPQDGHGLPKCAIDVDSELRNGSRMTQLRFPQQLKCLPVPTVPFLQRGCHEPDTEMELRGLDTYSDKAAQPKDTCFYERHFDIFDHLCYNPNAVDNTVWPGYQGGVDTRHKRLEPYRGVHCATTFPLNPRVCQNRSCKCSKSAKQCQCNLTGHCSCMNSCKC